VETRPVREAEGVAIRSLGPIAVVIAVSLAAAAPVAAQQKARPDLALTKASDDVANPDHGFQSENGDFSAAYTVKNKGNATSPKSEVRVALVPPLGGRIDVMIDPIPKLKPGKSFSTLVEDTIKLNMELGAYKAEICVVPHFKQLRNRKANDCRDVPKRYYLAKRSWTGTGCSAPRRSGMALHRKPHATNGLMPARGRRIRADIQFIKASAVKIRAGRTEDSWVQLCRPAA